MAASEADEGPLSLLGSTVRRSFTGGRFYLIYATAMSLLFVVGLGFAGGSAFTSTVPTLLPIFGVVGSMGALTIFTNDRMKGVLEYLMAYGVSPRRLFTNVLLAGLALVTVVLGVALGVGLSVYLGRGRSLGLEFTLLLGIYTLPMTYASVAFATTVGMYWTSLSSPRMGMNSPTGLAPFIGILPSLATLGAVLALGATHQGSTTSYLLIVGGAVALLAIAVLLLLGMIGRLLRRERLLSPA